MRDGSVVASSVPSESPFQSRDMSDRDSNEPDPAPEGTGEAVEPIPMSEIISQFRERHIQDIMRRVSAMLEKLIEVNDQIPFDGSFLTRFHSRTPPGISVHDYLLRIIKFCSLDKVVLLVLLYYIDLLSQSYPGFSINSLTVHRFIITSVTVASKGLCDAFCTNTYYAKVGGVSKLELNLLEVDFLTRTNYSIVPPYGILREIFTRLLTLPVSILDQGADQQLPGRSPSSRGNTPGSSDTTGSQHPKSVSKLRSVRGTMNRMLHPSKKQKGDV